MEKNESQAKILLIISMTIFGTIGIFVRYIPLSSGIIAAVRGFLGATVLLGIMAVKKKKISKDDIRKNLKLLLLSGVFIGINWIFLFESYRYTSVAITTVCYYLAPIFVIFLSAIFLKEKIVLKKIFCVITAFIGIILVSGVLSGNLEISQIKGIIYGIFAAMMYASVIILNKKIENIDIYEKTTIQLLSAALVVLPYALMTGKVEKTGKFGVQALIFLVIVGIIHTGISYALYFSTLNTLKSQTIGIFSYIDPAVAIILSVIILKEKLDFFGIIGIILILGSTFVSELSENT